MSPVSLSKTIKVNGKNVTERTIRRYFKYLKKDRNFNYFPNFRHDVLGLSSIYVLLYGCCANKLFGIIPYTAYVQPGICFKTFRNVHLLQYLIPFGYEKEFKELWEYAKKLKIIKAYKRYRCREATAVYQPFHHILSENHSLQKYDLSETKLEPYISLCNNTLEKGINKTMHKLIESYPVLVPLLCEQYGEHISSSEAWFRLKNKLGDKVWDYLPPKKSKRNKKDGVGINHIQIVMKTMANRTEELIQQIRVSYTPFYTNNIGIHLILPIKEKEKIIECTKKISKCSVQTIFTAPRDLKKDSCIFYVITNHTALNDLLTNVLPEYVNTKTDWNMFIQQTENIKETYSRIDYAKCFDPKTCSWKYEHKVYMRQIKNLAKELKTKKS